MKTVIEYPLNGVPCAICQRPGVSFVPGLGIRHNNNRVCKFTVDRVKSPTNAVTSRSAERARPHDRS